MRMKINYQGWDVFGYHTRLSIDSKNEKKNWIIWNFSYFKILTEILWSKRVFYSDSDSKFYTLWKKDPFVYIYLHFKPRFFCDWLKKIESRPNASNFETNSLKCIIWIKSQTISWNYDFQLWLEPMAWTYGLNLWLETMAYNYGL